MNRLNRSHIFFSLSFLLCSLTTHAVTEESVSHIPQISQDQQSEKLSEKVMKKAYTIINQIACMFGDLATLVQEDAIKTEDKEAKNKLNQEILKTRKIINQIAKDLDNRPGIDQLGKTIHILDALMKHLASYLEQDFTTYQAFDPSKHVKRVKIMVDTLQTEEEQLEYLLKAEKKVTSIQKKAEDTGLYWYNHLYRNTLDRFVVQPCSKYNLHWKGLYISAALAGATYLWYKMNTSTHGLTPEQKGTNEPMTYSYLADDYSFKGYCGYIHDKINGFVRKLGWTPKSEMSAAELQLITASKELARNVILEGDVIQRQETYEAVENLRQVLKEKVPVKWFGLIEKATTDALHGHWYLGAALLWEPFRTGLAETYKEYSGKLKNNLQGVHNWLKGGAYYQRHKNKKGSFGRIEPRYTFDDIIGLDNAKDILSNVVKYMKDPESYDRAGLTPSKGYLLIGPSRTGKTMLAEATAGEIKRTLGVAKELPFYSIEARWIAAEGNFDWMMRIAKENAPCIIFIDEIDMLNLHRDKFKNKTVLLSEFLSTLSGCMNTDPDKQVIIIAATNSPDKLDRSLLKRFGCHIPFEYPSFLNRAEFFISALEGKGLPVDQFDIRKLAEQTENCSFEDLHRVINNAQFVTRDQGRPLTQLDIERSLDIELHGIIYHDYLELPAEDEHILAIHMAGHAIAYTATEDTGIRMSQVTIRPVNSKVEKNSVLSECIADITLPNILYGHVFTHHKADSLKFISQKEIERLCMIELAGHVAEKLIFGSHHCAKNTCSNHDTSKAFYWARKYQLNGLDEQLIAKSSSIQNELSQKAYAFMNECEEKVRTLLESRIDSIKIVAEFLKVFGTLDKANMLSCIKLLNGKTFEELVQEVQNAQDAQAGAEASTEPIASETQSAATAA